jgi:WD40 repeat protein
VPDPCPSEHELLALHLGRLPEDRLDAVAEHVETCPACQAAVEQLEGTPDRLLSVLLKPLSAPARRPALDQAAPENWPHLSDFEVLAVLGRGGMGIVYRARQLRLNRLVALKRLPGDTDRALGRSRAEAEALARLQHPNIVQVHEVFEHDGSTYLALELVDGGPLAAHLGKPQNPRATAELIATLAEAVQHAHTHGVVHRDLKPDNILLHHEALPRGFGTPKITDFGVAKRLAVCGETLDGDIIGTPHYMSPEQAAGQVAHVGPATDVYSLGVILYEMLAGHVPLQGPTTLDTLLLVRTEDPLPPRRLQAGIPRDLETICLACLHKEPQRRYPSAAELAADLKRFLRGEPIRARPAPVWERAWKSIKRRPTVSVLSAAVVLVTALGFGLVAWQWSRAEDRAAAEQRARVTAEENERRFTRQSAGMGVTEGVTLCEKGEVGRGLLRLVRALELAERVGDDDLVRAARYNLAAWRPFLVRRRALLPHSHWVVGVAFSPDGKTALTASRDRTARLWDVATGRPLSEPLTHRHPVWAVAFSPDGTTFVTGSGTEEGATHASEVRFWDTASCAPRSAPLPHSGEINSVAFNRAGTVLLTCTDHEARLVRTSDFTEVCKPLRHPAPATPVPAHGPRLCALFNPDGTLVATGGEDNTVRLWNAATGAPRAAPLPTSGCVLALAFSPNGAHLATGCLDGTVRAWEVATGTARWPALQLRGPVRSVAFTPDGSVLVTGSRIDRLDPETGRSRPQRDPGEARLWLVESGQPLGNPLPHPSAVFSVAFSPGGGTLLTGCQDGQARFFMTATGVQVGPPLPHGGTVGEVVFSPDGRTALTSCMGNGRILGAQLWDAPPESALGRTLLDTAAPKALAFSPDGSALLVGTAGPRARLWERVDGSTPTVHFLPHNREVSAVAFAPDGRSFLTGSDDGIIRLWDRATRTVRRQMHQPGWVSALAFAPDGRTALAGTGQLEHQDGSAQLWTLETGQPLGTPLIHRWGAHTVAFGPNGETILTGDMGVARLRDRASLRVLREWTAPEEVTSALFYPGGKQILHISGGFAQVRNLDDDQAGAPPVHPEGGIGSAAFSPDGHSIVIAGKDGVCRLWDVVTGKQLGPPLDRLGPGPVAFSPTGTALAVGDRHGRIVLWHPPQPQTGTVNQLRYEIEVLTGMTLDDQDVIRPLTPTELHQRQP